MFSRKQVLQPKVLSLNAVTRNMAKMLPRLLGEDITLDLEHATGLPGIEADTGMIEQVIMNMAVNARDAMPKGGRLLLSTSATAFDKSAAGKHPDRRIGSFVRMSVRDTGFGMSRETMGRIFEPFFTTKQTGKGTGLGLATAYGI